MSKALESVKEFHQRFGLPIAERPIVPPVVRIGLREALIREETREFLDESEVFNPNIGNVAKELADILYVVYGAAIEWGIPIDDVFDEVHRSNMSKVWEDGSIRRRVDGKILKPPTYSVADVESILRRATAAPIWALGQDQ